MFSFDITGNIIGLIRDYKVFIQTLKQLRRKRFISEFVSMFVSTSLKCVYLASDGGRLCRPYIIVENQVPRLRQSHIEQLNLGEKTFEDFLKAGLIEYLDVNEESDAHITIYEKDLNRFVGLQLIVIEADMFSYFLKVIYNRHYIKKNYIYIGSGSWVTPSPKPKNK